MSDRELQGQIDALRREMSLIPVRWPDQTNPITSAGDVVGGGGCGCCGECFNCLTAAQALVCGCTAAPNCAPRQYILPMGATPFSDEGGASINTTLTYNRSSCSSSSGGTGGSGCSWYSCPVTVCSTSSSSSGSGSSSGSVCGVYQLLLELTLDADGDEVLAQSTGKFFPVA